MITEDYVSFESAKLLKEKGFDENTPVNYFVGDDKIRGCIVGEMIYHTRAEEDTHLIACPTLQMAMKWLREKHNLYCDIDYDFRLGWNIQITSLKEVIIDHDKEMKTYIPQPYSYSSYEEACEAAIQYCLQNLI